MADIKQEMNCGCFVAVDYNRMVQIDYCPKHKAAFAMYEALKALVGYHERTKSAIPCLADALQALSLAEGKTDD